MMKNKQISMALVQLGENLFPLSLLYLGSMIKKEFTEDEVGADLIDLGWIKVDGRSLTAIIRKMPEKCIYNIVTNKNKQKNEKILEGFIAGTVSEFELDKKNMVGFSVYDLETLKTALAFGRVIKDRNNSTIIFLGGPYTVILGEKKLRHMIDDFAYCIDCIIYGYGDPIIEFIKKYSGKEYLKNNLIHKDVKNAILDNAFLKAEIDAGVLAGLYSFYKTCEKKYQEKIVADTIILNYNVGHGCINDCAFCIDGYDRNLFFKEVAVIIDEVRVILNFFHQRDQKIEFYFECENLFNSNNFVKALCDNLIEEGLGITWSSKGNLCQADENLFPLLSRAGCKSIYSGLETIDANRQNIINKKTDHDDYMDKVNKLRSLGITVSINFIVGFPHEKINEVKKILTFIKENRCIETRTFGFALLLNSGYYRSPEKYGIHNLRPFSQVFADYCCDYKYDEINGYQWDDKNKLTNKTLEVVHDEEWINSIYRAWDGVI